MTALSPSTVCCGALWRLLTLAAICAGTLASCSDASDEPSRPDAPREICLQGAAIPASRAQESMPTDYSMWVSAIYTDNDGSPQGFYFTGAVPEMRFAYDAAASAWRGAAASAYAPFDGSLRFLAYSMPGGEAYKPQAAFTIDSDGSFGTLTLDFADKLDGTVPVVVSDLTDALCSSFPESPCLLFRQILACVRFELQPHSPEVAAALTVNALTLKGVRTSGKAEVTPSFTISISGLPGGESASEGSTVSWPALSTSTSALSILSSPITLEGTTPVTLERRAYLPPQYMTGVEVEVTLTLTDAAGVHTPRTLTAPLSATPWKPGYQYTYTLDLAATEIAVTCIPAKALLEDYTEEIINSTDLDP